MHAGKSVDCYFVRRFEDVDGWLDGAKVYMVWYGWAVYLLYVCYREGG